MKPKQIQTKNASKHSIKLFAKQSASKLVIVAILNALTGNQRVSTSNYRLTYEPLLFCLCWGEGLEECKANGL